MKRCSTSDLRRLEIINLCDGSRLGYASDFEFDKESERVLAIVIRGSSGFCGFGRGEDLIIPWHLIECIGEDTILVKLTQTDLSCCLCSEKRKRRFHF